MSADSAHGESGLILFAALAANLGIAIARFAAAGIIGSAAMLTEGSHSAVDRLKQILLLYGQKRAARPAGAVGRMIAGIEAESAYVLARNRVALYQAESYG